MLLFYIQFLPGALLAALEKNKKKNCTLRAEEDAVNLHYLLATMFEENIDTVKNMNVYITA
jgi:hypothetical protein